MNQYRRRRHVVQQHCADQSSRGVAAAIIAHQPAAKAQRQQRRPGDARHEQPTRRVERRANQQQYRWRGETMSAPPVTASNQAETMSSFFIVGAGDLPLLPSLHLGSRFRFSFRGTLKSIDQRK